MTWSRPVLRNSLIAVGVFLAGLALVSVLGDMIGAPSDSALAAALATGG